MTMQFTPQNRFGLNASERHAAIAAGWRWVVVHYGSGMGTPQTRDILAAPGETATEAAAAMLRQPGMRGDKLIWAAEGV